MNAHFSKFEIDKAKEHLGLCPDQDLQALRHLQQREILRERVQRDASSFHGMTARDVPRFTAHLGDILKLGGR